jgi:AcrR family transcriptional regulator
MGEGVVNFNPSGDGGRDRKAVRAAIIAAARAIAEREGVEAVSLGKAAAEAGLDRAAVYQHFARKEDLLSAIVSNDVATLMRTVRDIDGPSGDAPELSDSAKALSALIQDHDGPGAEREVEMVGLARDVSAALAQLPSTEATSLSTSSNRLRARRADLLRMLDTDVDPEEDVGQRNVERLAEPKLNVERLTESEPTDEKSARTPDVWLERRLREFERAMTSMESRYAQVEKTSREASLLAEEHIQTLQQTIRELRERADGAEARQKASSSEFRAALNEAALRIQTIEGVARAALAEDKTPEAPVAETVAPPPPPPPPPPQAASEPPPFAVDMKVDPEPTIDIQVGKSETPPKSAMGQMRRTAIAANAAAAAETAKVEETSGSNMSRFVVAGGVLLLALVVAAGIAFSKGVYDGRHEAMAQASAGAPAHLAVTTVPLIVPPHQTALDLLTTRAQAGDAGAEYAIATKYLRGTDTAKDPAAALHWLTLAAIHGQPVAQYLLGSLYQQGVGTPADAAKAMQWFEAAALQGNRRAMHNLGIAFAQGLGTERNLPEAVRWFSRAAAMGYVDSEFNLAVLYERGDGVPQSLLDAYKWYVIASRQGDAESRQRVDALKTQLNPDDLAAAQRAAAAFRPLPSSDAANIPPA